MLTDFQILQHGPGQEDAPWPYDAQLYFGRAIEAEVRREDEAMRQALQSAVDAMELALSSHNKVLTSDPPQSAWRYHNVSMKLQQAIAAARARLDPQKLREGETT